MQRTLIIFKPDCMEKKLAGAVLDRFERAGFTILGIKLARLTPELLREHYAHVADRPFYPELERFMSSRPVIVMALAGQGVIGRVREMLGPTDATKAPKGTIRGDFGTDQTVNVVHASDSPENAEKEIARFFKPDELPG
ncbi:MAG: nucleoside-diphosphate kinase [Opitutaceae bacterium]|jgi:nucleoside-diphosphate kinase|nr:nucleoside-diphosphate kinase [Opitutaceae bacterium]